MRHKTTRPYRLRGTKIRDEAERMVVADWYIASYASMRAALRGLRRRERIWPGVVLSIYFYGQGMCCTAAPETVRDREAEAEAN